MKLTDRVSILIVSFMVVLWAVTFWFFTTPWPPKQKRPDLVARTILVDGRQCVLVTTPIDALDCDW